MLKGWEGGSYIIYWALPPEIQKSLNDQKTYVKQAMGVYGIGDYQSHNTQRLQQRLKEQMKNVCISSN